MNAKRLKADGRQKSLPCGFEMDFSQVYLEFCIGEYTENIELLSTWVVAKATDYLVLFDVK